MNVGQQLNVGHNVDGGTAVQEKPLIGQALVLKYKLVGGTCVEGCVK
jgi:hypothetical protein